MKGITKHRSKKGTATTIGFMVVFSLFTSTAVLADDKNKNVKKHKVTPQKKSMTKFSNNIKSKLQSEINARIAGDKLLQNAIAELAHAQDPSLTVGPAGEKGLQGEQGIQGVTGPAGEQGPQGEQGAAGQAGLHCWDLNSDNQQDPSEDINQDGYYNALDCQGTIEIKALLEDLEYLKKRLANSDLDQDGYSPNEGDCDDASYVINPAALDDTQDGIDNDCDGKIDNNFVEVEYRDTDGDGFTPAEGDCDDHNYSVNPGVLDNTSNGVDDNCDGITDNQIPSRELVYSDSFDDLFGWTHNSGASIDSGEVKMSNGSYISKRIENSTAGPVQIQFDLRLDSSNSRDVKIIVAGNTLATYDHNFSGRGIVLDLPRSLTSSPFNIRIEVEDNFFASGAAYFDNLKVYVN